MNMFAADSIAPPGRRGSVLLGAAIDERVAQIDANEVVTFMHNDKQNSKCAIALRATLARGVIAISDVVGNPVGRRGYGVYGGEADQGEVRGTSTPLNDPAQMVGTTSAGTSPHPFGYTGRRWDPDLGLYYYRARWYDPQLGTFLQTDPIGSLDYVNLYAYVGLEPGNGVDPSGMVGVDFTVSGAVYEFIGSGGGAGVGVSYTRERGLEVGVTVKLQAGLGAGGGGSAQIGGFLGNMSDRNGNSAYIEGGGGIVGSFSTPLGRNQVQGGASKVIPSRATLGAGPRLQGSTGVQIERTATLSAAQVRDSLRPTVERAKRAAERFRREQLEKIREAARRRNGS
jgi:RHS repeat-associated protein